MKDSQDKTIAFSGERMVPGKALEIFFQEHFERYQFAREFIKDKVVLESGCGEGYGSNYLAETASQVVAIDKSSETILHAAGCYKRDNLEFKSIDATDASFGPETFDVVCAFEIFEHIQNYEKFINQMKKVLKPGGIFIVSTPNKKMHSPGRKKPRSPYHYKEFYLNEFQVLLEKYFNKVEIYNQPPSGFLSTLYVFISRHIDLARFGWLFLFVQKCLLKLPKRSCRTSQESIALALKKECRISKKKFPNILSFVAVCKK